MARSADWVDELQGYKDFLGAAVSGDKIAFQEAIVGAQRYLGMTQGSIAQEFRCCRASVNRWSQGVSAPHIGLRRFILERLSKRVSARIAQARRLNAPPPSLEEADNSMTQPRTKLAS